MPSDIDVESSLPVDNVLNSGSTHAELNASGRTLDADTPLAQ
jgi:hypothetical protein